ncbi:hypothetical protein BTM_5578 [Burkholderia thailandensis 34]|nr:hypothetical protein BTM_5578 [Burkholderia thailandensis 34]
MSAQAGTRRRNRTGGVQSGDRPFGRRGPGGGIGRMVNWLVCRFADRPIGRLLRSPTAVRQPNRRGDRRVRSCDERNERAPKDGGASRNSLRRGRARRAAAKAGLARQPEAIRAKRRARATACALIERRRIPRARPNAERAPACGEGTHAARSWRAPRPPASGASHRVLARRLFRFLRVLVMGVAGGRGRERVVFGVAGRVGGRFRQRRRMVGHGNGRIAVNAEDRRARAGFVFRYRQSGARLLARRQSCGGVCRSARVSMSRSTAGSATSTSAGGAAASTARAPVSPSSVASAS